jgi:hypothetical protein
VGSTYIHRHDVAETDLTRVQTPEESRRIREGRKRGRGSVLSWIRGDDQVDDGDDAGHPRDDTPGDAPGPGDA